MTRELNAGIVTGLTLTCVPYLAGVAQTPITMTELGTTGMYQGDMTGSAGTYALVFLASSVTRATGTIIWDGTAEVTVNATNVSKVAGTAQTARDIGASVIAASVTSGVTLAASQHVIVDSGTITTYTGNTPQTGDNFARIGAAGAGLTALGDTRIANLDAAVSTRSTYAGGAVASVTGAVGSVTGLTASDVAAIKAKTDLIPTIPAAVGSEMILTVAYNAAKTAATQASVDDLPTNAELATALGTADDAVLAQVALVKAKTDTIAADVWGYVP